jgi:tripartite ATP-independent transporter DctP family solute receptor
VPLWLKVFFVLSVLKEVRSFAGRAAAFLPSEEKSLHCCVSGGKVCSGIRDSGFRRAGGSRLGRPMKGGWRFFVGQQTQGGEKMSSKFTLCLVAGMVALGVGASAAAADKKVIKISHAHAGTMWDSEHTAAWVFKNWVNENSDTLEVRVYPNSSLGQEREVAEQMQFGGGASCMLSGTAILNNFAKRTGVIDLPFLWKDPEHLHRALDGKVGAELAGDIEKAGLKVIGWFNDWGYRNVLTSKKQVSKPEDLKGLKIRTIQSPIYIAAIESMGASPTPMAMGEVYTSMQTGVIDGFEHTAALMLSMKYYEVGKYLALTRHFLAPLVWSCSLKEWKSWTPQEQKLIQEAAYMGTTISRALLAGQENEALVALKEKGVTVSEVDTSAMRERAKAVQDKIAKELGAESLLAEIRGLAQ